MIFKGVIFDMDGVLCDSEHFICEAACRMFKAVHGVTVQPDDFIPFVGAGEDRYLGGVAEKYGVPLTLPRDKAETYRIYLELIQGRLQPLPGVHAFVTRCKTAGLKCAVATSADRIKMEGNLKEIALPADWFDFCINGNEVRHKKPDPEIFLKAAAGLRLDPADCLVVEDALNGVQAAGAAGARALGLTSGFTAEELRQAGAEWTAPDLSTVPQDLIQQLKGA
jgi:HAD superfamily hydrolase (TIGR01509 family)